MNIGTTFDEKILKYRIIEEWLEIISENGASFIEISPHPSVLDLKDYQSIANKASNFGMKTSFHVPYFANQAGFQLTWDITARHQVLKNHKELFHWIEDIHGQSNGAYLVLHGAAYENGHKKSAMDTTLRYMDAFLNDMATKNHKTTLLLETLCIEDEKAIGNHWEELESILNTFQCDQLQICWDLCHDLRNHLFQLEHIETLPFSKVPYMHIHGFHEATQKSHVSVSDQKPVYEEAIRRAIQFGFKGPINLELLKTPCGETYEKSVTNDLKWLQETLTTLE